MIDYKWVTGRPTVQLTFIMRPLTPETGVRFPVGSLVLPTFTAILANIIFVLRDFCGSLSLQSYQTRSLLVPKSDHHNVHTGP